jgi:hypothetical protein
MSTPTSYQRLHVRCLLIDLEISSLHVTDELLPYCEAAGITTWSIGDRIDDRFNAITSVQARALAKALIRGAVVPA